MNIRSLACVALMVAAAMPLAARADMSGNTIKIGILTDLSSIYSDYAGQNTITAVKMAVEDAGGKINGKTIEILTADFQNKPDISLAIARKWIDVDGVDVIVDAPNSAVAIALQSVIREKNKVFLTGAFSSELTGKHCSPNTMQFQSDSYSVATGIGGALVGRGLKTWYSITADYAMGQAIERDLVATVKAGGGRSVGAVRHPFGASDMSSFVLQAQASRAQVLSLNSSGGDVQNLLRAVNEYGVNKSMKVVAPGMELLDAYRLGRKIMAGAYMVDIWYWDLNDETRAFARRFSAAHPKNYYPSRSQAAHYSMVSAYLRAVKSLNDDTNGKAVMDKIKSFPITDVYTKGGRVRADGRLITDMLLVEVKGEGEPRKNDWDLYRVVSTIPAEKAFLPVSRSECDIFKNTAPFQGTAAAPK